MKKHEFKYGDGMSAETSTPEERKEIYKLLEEKGYKVYITFNERPERSYENNLVLFDDYFMFLNLEDVLKRAYTYQEMLFLINGEPETIQVSKQLIIDLHKQVYRPWKLEIEKELPELFPKNKIGYLVDVRHPKWLGYSINGINVKWLINAYGEWSEDGVNMDVSEYDEPATPKEVESRLWKMADKLGLTDAKIEKSLSICSLLNQDLYQPLYNSEEDTLWNTNGCIYNKGKWATPLKEEMPEELKNLVDKLGKETILKWVTIKTE